MGTMEEFDLTRFLGYLEFLAINIEQGGLIEANVVHVERVLYWLDQNVIVQDLVRRRRIVKPLVPAEPVMWYIVHVRSELTCLCNKCRGIDWFGRPLSAVDAAKRIRRIKHVLSDPAKITNKTKPPSWDPKPRRRRAASPPRPPTPQQLKAVTLFTECGNIAEVARQMGVDRKTAQQHLDAGFKKVGKIAVRRVGVRTTKLPVDHSGQTDVAGNDDGPAATGRPRVKRDQRRD